MERKQLDDEAYYAGLNDEEKYYAKLQDKLIALSHSHEQCLSFFLSLSIGELKGLRDDARRRAAYHHRKLIAYEEFERMN